MSRMTVYNVKNREDIDRKPGSGKKAVLDLKAIREALEGNSLKSLRSHVVDMGVGPATLQRTVKKMGEKSLVRMDLHRCKGILNNIKKALAGCVIVFSDEKTFTVDPVRNCRNDHYVGFRDINVSARTLTMTKHPSSAMTLGSVASNGEKLPVIWFPTGYCLTGPGFWPKNLWPPYSPDCNPLDNAVCPYETILGMSENESDRDKFAVEFKLSSLP